MTRKEWVEKNYPAMVDDQYLGGVLDCPHDYEDLPDNDTSDCLRHTCEGCWNKKIGGCE